jgi:predicted RNase H-related nuclease YkuK (DUF458 family)
MKKINGFEFHSPTFGSLTFNSVREKILEFMADSPDHKYHLVVGTDSQPKNGQGTDFVTAIVIHRIGIGGIYFWKRVIEEKKLVLRYRIYQEATLSLETAEKLLELCRNDGITKYDVEIHVDIGKFGKTREMITEIVGMVRSMGYTVKTKPESYGATKVADKHT